MKKVKLIIEATKEENEITIPLHIRGVDTCTSFNGEPKLVITAIGEKKSEVENWGKLAVEATPFSE